MLKGAKTRGLSTVKGVEPDINLNNVQPMEKAVTSVKDSMTLLSNVAPKEQKGTCTDCARIISL